MAKWITYILFFIGFFLGGMMIASKYEFTNPTTTSFYGAVILTIMTAFAIDDELSQIFHNL